LTFKEDLLALLKQYGRLPYETVAESLQDVERLEHDTEQLREENKQQKELITQ